MEFRKLIYTLAFTTAIVFFFVISGSYAYYTLDNGTSLDVTTSEFDRGVAVVFTQQEYINTKTGVPVAASDVDRYASKSVFIIDPDESVLQGFNVSVTVSLVDISIADELKVSDFKYDLTCNDGTTDTVLTNGIRTGTDFTSEVLTNNRLVLGTLSTANNTLDINKNYTCTLRVWLQDSGSSQNTLMNKNFSGLVKVNSVFKK